jgi:molybdopterin biosynthesis enzyme MoaB
VIRARVIVASNRAAAGVYADTSGPLLVAGLRDLGCEVDPEPVVVPDGEPVAEALRAARADGIAVVLSFRFLSQKRDTAERCARNSWHHQPRP